MHINAAILALAESAITDAAEVSSTVAPATMNFHIDVPAFVQTLPIMLYGMLGGLAVMLLICLILMLLYRVGGRKGKAQKEA